MYLSSSFTLEKKLKRRYTEHLHGRLKKLRRLLMEKNAIGLRSECALLAGALEIDSFGFGHLKIFAQIAHEKLPPSNKLPGLLPLEGRVAVEILIQEIDACMHQGQIVPTIQ